MDDGSLESDAPFWYAIWSHGETYTITGPAAVTHAEMAGAIAEPTGRDVAFVDVPPNAFAGALSAAGVPPWQVDGLTEDYGHYARGEAEHEGFPRGWIAPDSGLRLRRRAEELLRYRFVKRFIPHL